MRRYVKGYYGIGNAIGGDTKKPIIIKRKNWIEPSNQYKHLLTQAKLNDPDV